MSEQRAEYVIWNGQVAVRDGQLRLDLPIRVTFDLGRKFVTQFIVDGLPFRPETDSVLLQFPQMPNEIQAIKAVLNPFLDKPSILSPRYSRSWIGNGQMIRKVHGGIVNLGGFAFRGRGQDHACELASNDGWRVELQPVSHTLEFPPQIQSPEYRFTHHFSLVRADEHPFSAENVEEQISKLCTFLSFCRGAWVSTALTTGVDDSGALAYAEWGTGKLSPPVSEPSWLDQLHGVEMAAFYPAFCARIADQAFAETFRIALYWQIRSNPDNVGPDGGLILLQTALERIAWHVLVRERRALNAEGFGRLTACDQLRLLLTVLSIPTSIPDQLIEAAKLGRTNGADGPQCLTLIRNSLVHPPKKLASHPEYPYYEAYVLAKWYLELVLLRLLGYEGTYSNRTKRRWAGQVEPVPWRKT